MDHSDSYSIDSLTMSTIQQLDDLTLNENTYPKYNSNDITSYKRMRLIKMTKKEEKGIYKKNQIQAVFDKIFSNYSNINY